MKLELLGYSQKWLEYEFLTEEQFQEQIAIFHQGEDQNTEHYR